MMRRIARRVTRLRDEQSGLSMTELLVAAMLTTVMLALVGTMFVQITRLTTAANQGRTSNGVAADMSNSITSVLRVAATRPVTGSVIPEAAIVAGTRSSLTLYSYSNTDGNNPLAVKMAKITYTLNASGALTETRCTGVLTGGFWYFSTCTPSTTRTLGTGLLAPTGVTDQLFTYRDGNGDPYVIGTGSLSDTQRASVGSITVTVRVRAEGTTSDPVIISSTVVLRNLGLDTGL